MAGKSNTSATFFAQKKLLGKAHTSNLKTDGEELIGSNIQAASSQIFGQNIPLNPSQTLYLLQSASDGAPATVEYIHFALTVLTGTTYDANETNPDGGSGADSGESSQSSGPHSYKFVFRSDYESNSNNPKKGTIFNDDGIVHETLGKVQLVPPFFSQVAPNPYIINIYEDNGSGGIGDQIPLLDNIDWNVDFYNGILFLQDYNASKIPAHAKAFAYVGDFADKGFFETGLSGSLTQLTDGTSYLAAGNNITITSGSGGQITIAAAGGGSDTQNTLDQAYDEGGVGLGAKIIVDNQPVQLKVEGSTSTALAITGSVLIGSGADGTLPSFPGTDVNFFVSGTIGGSGTTGVSAFGGDLAVSGALALNQGAAAGSQVFVTTTGKVGIGTNNPTYKLSVGGSMEIGEYLYHRNDADTFVRFQADEITLNSGGKNMINLKEDGTDTQVLILSGGSAASTDESLGADVNFYVSGSVNSKGTSTRGTSVFGGDVFISGSLSGSSIVSNVYSEYVGEADGTNTAFTLDHEPNHVKNVSIFVNGLMQMPATSITSAPFQDYSVTGSTIFFVSASLPDKGSFLFANYSTIESI